MQHFKPNKVNNLAVMVALILSGNTSALANAQDSPDNANTKQKNLEVITVTTQKRVQNLQEVSAAVTAVTGDTLEKESIQDIYDLQANVPGLRVFQSQTATNSTFSIRGVGTSAQNFGLESSVGLYVDGVYRARQNSMINNYVDIEAVEVLRGPQGTLFGKNTPMGAINVRTKAPRHDDADAYIDLTIGNYGLFSFAGASSFTAIDDVLSFRATGFGSQRDGTISDLTFGENIINDRDRFGGRLQALYTPNDDVTLRIIADYSEIDEKCCGANASVNNFVAPGVPGQVGTDSLLASPLFNSTIIRAENFDDRTTAFSFLPEATMDDSGLSAELNWRLDKNYTFTSLSAYRRFNSFDYTDPDFTQASLLGKKNDAEQRSFSQELRLDYDSEKMHVVGGLYYFTQDLDVANTLTTGEDFNQFALSGLFGGALNPVLEGINQISALTGGLVAPAAVAAPLNASFPALSEQDHESYAIFGQVEYKLNEQFTLTAGLRFTKDNKDLVTRFEEIYASGAEHPTTLTSIGDQTNPQTIVPGTVLYSAAVVGQFLPLIANGTIAPGTPAFGQAVASFAPFQQEGWALQSISAVSAARPDIEAELDDDQVSGTIKLSYQHDENTLLYTSFGTGYKSGGTNTDRIAEAFDPVFDAETSESFEVGMKKDFPEYALRLNIAGHITKVKDFQLSSFIGNGFNLQNAGDYDTSGIEIETSWLMTDATSVSVNYSFVDAKYATFEQGPCWAVTPWQTGNSDPGQTLNANGVAEPFCDRANDKPLNQPEHTAFLQLSHELEISDDIWATASVDYNYVGEFFSEASNDPLSEVDASSFINARILVTFDEYDFDLLFWGRNITDEESKGAGLAATLQTGKLVNFYIEPATYGVTFRKQF